MALPVCPCSSPPLCPTEWIWVHTQSELNSDINPAVARLAQDTNYFTSLSNDRADDTRMVIGDAGLRIYEAPDGGYNLIDLDRRFFQRHQRVQRALNQVLVFEKRSSMSNSQAHVTSPIA